MNVNSPYPYVQQTECAKVRKSFLPLAMPLPPGEETYYFREASGREITTQKEEDRRREKRQQGTTDCGQHWTCALR